MNILDENINDSQRQQLRNWRVAVRQIGFDLGKQGLKDKEEAAFFIRRFLHQKEIDTSAKRMGNVIWVSHTGVLVWQLHADKEIRFRWD